MSGRRTVAGLMASLVVAGTLAPGADDAGLSICPLVSQQERNDLEDLRLEVALTETELVAAEQIFELLDGLWKADAVARLIYLTGKHDRDAAKLRMERATLLVARQDALMKQLDLLCSEESVNRSAAQREQYDRAHAAYLKADCDRLATEVALAEVDLAYRKELLTSALDLRENDVATRQDVIRAERDVAMARKRRDDGNRRVSRCREKLSRPGAVEHP